MLSMVTLFSTVSLFAQQDVTIREMNTYSAVPTSTSDLTDSNLNSFVDGTKVKFVAVVSSYGKNSGLASYTESSNSIGRVHLFVTDTTALSQGRDGMSLQIVESTLSLVEELSTGDVVEVDGNLSFFGGVAQFNADNVVTLGSVFSDTQFEKYAPLLDPVTADVSDLNAPSSDGLVTLNWANYSKYSGAYVKIENATVVNVDLSSDRPVWALRKGDAIIYIYDTSLRYRNDRNIYKTGYNWRRSAEQGGEDDFVPPPPGALINVSGYITLNNFNIDNHFSSENGNDAAFRINPWDDGVIWLNDEKFVDGVDGFEWNNDLEVVGFPPAFENFTQSLLFPSAEDQVSISVDVFAQADGATLDSVWVEIYTATDTTSTKMENTDGDTYEYQFATYDIGSNVAFIINAVDSDGLVGQFPASGANSFIVISSVDKISIIQTPATGDASPFVGLGMVEMAIKGIITADAEDGFIIVQDGSGVYSGIYLDSQSNVNDKATTTLVRGDSIRIDSAIVAERYNVTYLQEVAFEVLSSGNDYSSLIPSITTEDYAANGEGYEGMVVTITNAVVSNLQADGSNDYGEFSITTSGKTISVRVDDGVPGFGTSSNISSSLNENLILDAPLGNVVAAGYFSFSNYKLILRTLDDISGENYTYPKRNVSLNSPADGAIIEVIEDVIVEWDAMLDYDGGDVTYKWFLSSRDDSTFATPIAINNSDNGGADAILTMIFAEVDGGLNELGLAVGDSILTVWTIFGYSQGDSVQVSTYAPVTFTPVFYELWIKRGLESSIEDGFGLPSEFSLNQNYPNPFNPATTIGYTLPTKAKVTIEVYNVLGERVALLINKEQPAGSYNANFDASRLASGIYFYRLNAGEFVTTKKMTLIK